MEVWALLTWSGLGERCVCASYGVSGSNQTSRGVHELPVDDIDRALFAAATRVKVRNGRTVRFWMTPWFQGNTMASMFPNLFQAFTPASGAKEAAWSAGTVPFQGLHRKQSQKEPSP
jgi:hypothetical protein